MNDLKHTPGPLTLRESGRILSGDTLIGKVFWNPENPNGIEEAKANGLLFTAAPELLDALQECYAWLDSVGAVMGLSEKVEAAIAKATGKESA